MISLAIRSFFLDMALDAMFKGFNKLTDVGPEREEFKPNQRFTWIRYKSRVAKLGDEVVITDAVIRDCYPTNSGMMMHVGGWTRQFDDQLVYGYTWIHILDMIDHCPLGEVFAKKTAVAVPRSLPRAVNEEFI